MKLINPEIILIPFVRAQCHNVNKEPDWIKNPDFFLLGMDIAHNMWKYGCNSSSNDIINQMLRKINIIKGFSLI